MRTANEPLNTTQLELLKLFSTNLSDNDLKELKSLLADFYSQKSIQTADDAWKAKGLNQKNMDDWLNGTAQ